MNKEKQQQYKEYVEEKTPKNNLYLNMVKAFIVGGIICLIGQALLNFCVRTAVRNTPGASMLRFTSPMETFLSQVNRLNIVSLFFSFSYPESKIFIQNRV